MDPVVENGIKRFCDKFIDVEKVSILSEIIFKGGQLF
jgi:hypothetical protein